MKGGLASAHVVDAEGRVVASSDERPAASLDDAPKQALPDGGALVLCPAPEEAWQLFARAFVHEVRSPLNAMVLYLELAGTRPTQTPQPGRSAPSLEYLLGRVQDQVKRVDDLLAMFGSLWAPKAGDPTDLALLARNVTPFARHEAFRRELELETHVCPSARITADAALVAEALVALLGAGLESEKRSVLALHVEEDGDEAVVTLSASGGAFPTSAASRALARAGARVESGGQGVRAAFKKS